MVTEVKMWQSVHKYVGLGFYLAILNYYFFALKASSKIEEYEHRDKVDPYLKQLGEFWFYFFTIWSFGLQIFFLITAILDELSKLLNFSIGIQKSLSRTRAFLFNTLVFPFSLLVVTVFWTIWHIDRELILPKAVDVFFPAWLNHTLHTFIVVPLIIELLLSKKYNFVQFRNAAAVFFVVTTVYQALYLSIYLQHGIWLYPVYKILNWPQRIILTLSQLAIGLAYQKIGIVIQNSKRSREKPKVT